MTNEEQDQHVSFEDMLIIKQLRSNIEKAEYGIKNAELSLQKSHMETRAAEAEMRAAQAEFNGTMMRILWKYKLDETDNVRESDGLIIRGDVNDTSKERKS